ncbi:MAG: DNA mismatch repair endonuclease MutH, partial [Myxococcales bacterium]
ASLGVPVLEEPRHAKGWIGGLLEQALGATAGSRAAPDFEALGVEMKTLPVDATGLPLESTFVSSLNMNDSEALSAWERSPVRRKLARVLWVPIEGAREIPLGARRIGVALLWSPDAEQEAALRKDWEEIADLIHAGFVEQITGHQGRYLQLRPKGADGKALRWGTGEFGEKVKVRPKGFYLRPSFTAELLRKSYVLPGPRGSGQ